MLLPLSTVKNSLGVPLQLQEKQRNREKQLQSEKCKVHIKLYSLEVSQMNLVLNKLISMKNVSIVRLAPTRNKICYRKGPHGKGYAVWNKYQLSLKRATCMVTNTNTLNNVLKVIKGYNVYNKISFQS